MNFHQAAIPTLNRTKVFFTSILSTDLVGVYVHSSLVTGCYNPALSDIDFIVVIKRPLMSSQRRQIIDFSIQLDKDAPGKGIEYSIVTLDQIRYFTYPTHNELSFSYHSLHDYTIEELYAGRPTPNPDLPGYFGVIHARGAVLYGALIQEVFRPIPRDYFLRALFSDVEYIGTMIQKKPFYGILNLCRIYAYKCDGTFLSKKEGGEWGLQHLHQRHHPLIKQALIDYETRMSDKWNSQELQDFFNDTRNLIIV